MKLFFFDLETTGVKFWRNGIHQISGEIVIDGIAQESFNFKTCPNPKCEIEDEALSVCNVTREQILQYPPMQEIYKQLVEMLAKYVDRYNRQDKFFLVGYNNASFDNQFLKAFFTQNNDNYFYSWFWVNSIDVMVMASHFLAERRHTMKDFKQETVAREFGIEIEQEKLHDAAYDIQLTREIYHRIGASK